MDDIEALKAESAIRQLYARYGDAVWRQDLDAFADCYAEDCEWRIMGMVLKGREQIVWNFGRILPRYRKILFSFGTPILTIGEGTAESRVYVAELSGMTDGSAFAPIGVYYDRIVRHADRWRFSWRMFQTHYAGPPDLSGNFFQNPDFGPPPNMPALDDETIDHTGISAKVPGA
jgi:ketosteroid isomerase-like protein